MMSGRDVGQKNESDWRHHAFGKDTFTKRELGRDK